MNDAGRLSLQHLTYLIVLVTEGHVTRAADKVGISQPAMSAVLARLRRLFHDPILVRTTTGMQPTTRALALADKARVAVELLSGGSESAEAFDPARAEGHLRFLASEGVAEVVVPEMMAAVRRQAPNLHFTFRSGDIRRSAEYLRDGDVDFAMGFIEQGHEELHQMLLYPQRVVCVASRDHPEVRGSLSRQQFLAQAHVAWGAEPVPVPAIEALVDHALKAQGASRRIVARVASLSTSVALVARTDLLAVVPQRMATRPDITERCQILPLPFATDPFDVQLLWHARWHRDPTHAWIRQVARRVARALQARFAP